MNSEQLEEVRQHAEAGEGLPPAEHLLSVEASLANAARSKMEASLHSLRESFARMKEHVPTLEDAEPLKHKLNKTAEQTKVAIRNERRHTLHEAERMRKDKDISEEEYSIIAAGVQRLTDHFIVEIDEMIEKKISELSHPL